MAQKTTRPRRGTKSAERRPPSHASGLSTGPGLWERLPGRLQHAVCLVLLLIVSLAFFAPIHFSGKTLVPGDTVGWRAMAEEVLEYREETGEQALWAPNAFAGMPAYKISYPLAVWQLDDVPRMLRGFLWPTSHFLVLLTGAYLLVFLLTRNRLAGLLGAVAYGLSTYLIILLIAGHNTKFVALAYVPWAAVAFAYVLRNPGLLSGLLFAIALAVNFRSGHEQITYYLAFLLGIWWIVEAVGAVREARLKAFGAATGWMAAGVVLALLMVAQPNLVNLEYKAYTTRGSAEVEGGEALDWTYAMNWSQGVGELVTLVVARAFGGSGATYWGPKPFTGGPHYVGGIVMLLALFAVWRVRRRAVWAFGIAALLMTLFALGEHFAVLNRPMFDYFPLFDAFRVPETWLSVVVFALAVLAAVGASHLVDVERDAGTERQKWKSFMVTAGVVAGFVVLLLVGRGAFFDFERPGEQEELAARIAAGNNVPQSDPRVAQAAQQVFGELKEQRVDAFTGDALHTLFFVVAAVVVLWLVRGGRIPAWTAQLTLALLVVIDLWIVDRRYLSEETLVDDTEIEEQIPAYDVDRYLLEQGAGDPGQFRVLSLEGNPTTTARPSYFYESLGGYHGAKLRLYQDYLDHILFEGMTGTPNENALDLLSTRYVISPAPLPGLETVYRGEETGFLVLENHDALPRAFLVGDVEVVETREQTWERLRSPSFDPRAVALLAEPIGFDPAPVDSGSIADVTLERYSPDEIVWRVRSDAPRLLVAGEVYYPAGWEAEIDGEEAPIYRADYLLRAVPVPAGEHTLTMRFAPATHGTGVWISALSTILTYGAVVVLLGLILMRRRRQAGAPS